MDVPPRVSRLNPNYNRHLIVFSCFLVLRKGFGRFYWMCLFSLVYTWWTRFLRVSGLKSGGVTIYYTQSHQVVYVQGHTPVVAVVVVGIGTMAWFRGGPALAR